MYLWIHIYDLRFIWDIAADKKLWSKSSIFSLDSSKTSWIVEKYEREKRREELTLVVESLGDFIQSRGQSRHVLVLVQSYLVQSLQEGVLLRRGWTEERRKDELLLHSAYNLTCKLPV